MHIYYLCIYVGLNIVDVCIYAYKYINMCK
jgi:hypothetical protein